jgi:hypothetical protein
MLAQRGEKPRPAWKNKELQYADQVYEANIRTVQLYRQDDELSFPYLVLGQGSYLNLEFDMLQAQPEQLFYTIEHCDANWQRSMLIPIEYYSSFLGNPMNDYRSSQNTRTPYIHYQLTIPKEGTAFKVSGNYLLKVYRNGNERDLLLTRRFVVAEEGIRIVPDLVTLPSRGATRGYQTVNFSLYPTRVPMRDPSRELQFQLVQNGRWQGAATPIEPAYQYPDHLEYRFDRKLEYSGGNEFRWFDLRDVSRATNRVASISYTDSCDQVQLLEDKARPQLTYFTEPDFDGAYYIGTRQYPMADVEADYLCTTFSLRLPDSFPAGELYIRGAFSLWQLDPTYRLFRLDDMALLTTKLKQGIYNYEYVLLPPEGSPQTELLEGSFSETGNTYHILVYYRQPTDRYDRLIGLEAVSTSPAVRR